MVDSLLLTIETLKDQLALVSYSTKSHGLLTQLFVRGGGERKVLLLITKLLLPLRRVWFFGSFVLKIKDEK